MAIAIAEETGTSGKDLAQARFIRARVLWDASPAAHEQAIALARQARDGLHAEGGDPGEIDRWLAAHAAP